ncbi:MAG: NAD(P)-dependent oxidoreductase [Helicobacteraceae bacterium]|jgi:putative NADH-flavin reductase|nr:NAD(P)-dependent oxidoreductase [Helicobacteraceae bacterium]
MKIAVIGANGKAGSLIVKEAVNRGHNVTAIVRDENKAAGLKADKVLVKDLFKLTYDDVKEYEVIVDAFGAWSAETIPLHISATKHLCDILSGKENRLIIVGGAGSLYVNPERTVMLIDTPEFPDMFKPLAKAQGQALQDLRGRNDVRWTFLSPAADFRADGGRTGKYKSGGEELMVDSQGVPQISYADYAIALVDEAEKGEHIKSRFSVVAQ